MNNERLCDHTLFMRSILVISDAFFALVEMTVAKPSLDKRSSRDKRHEFKTIVGVSDE